ncbi:DUF58 domain-containing protein, partial [Shewanella sp. 0m-11]
QAAHLATTLGWSAILHGDRLGALIATEEEHIELKPRSRQQGILQVISAIKKLHENQLRNIAEQEPEPDHLAKACQRLRRLAKPGSLIWIISDGSHFTPGCLAALSDLKRHCDMGAFLVTDPLRQGQLSLPKHFQLPVREGSKELIIDRNSYEQWLANQQNLQNQFIEMMQKLNVETRIIDAGQRLNQQLGTLR